jgi:putative flavoprotein involved in K+ transport
MRVDTIIVGAGHAGLAVSRLLTDAGHDHVVLDRGRVAERWRTERWDSLHLLTPNWMTRLPGWCYTGADPDGYLSSAELIQHLERYAASFRAPVIQHTNVVEIATTHGPARERFRVVTDTESWHARHVVVAPARLAGLTCPAA